MSAKQREESPPEQQRLVMVSWKEFAPSAFLCSVHEWLRGEGRVDAGQAEGLHL